MDSAAADRRLMKQALRLARLGEGHVEPNPMVGCVIAQGERVVGEGWHQQFGGPHAEVNALAEAGQAAQGATLYVTLEPCCHHGKTPPCTDAILRAGITRVVVATADPFPAVAGQGIAQLRASGVTVDLLADHRQAQLLIAPFVKLVTRQRPWVIAKWAMTLDGKLATRTGNSQWISSGPSRAIVHGLRGRVDAVMVGSGTALLDDPLLTARPSGARVAARIVVDSLARLPLESQLVQTSLYAPVYVAVGEQAERGRLRALRNAGCEILVCTGPTHVDRLCSLLDQLGARRWTNVLCEGGAGLLGGLMEVGEIDEAHVFVAPKLVGGNRALSPIAGSGLARMAEAWYLDQPVVDAVGDDVYIRGMIRRPPAP